MPTTKVYYSFLIVISLLPACRQTAPPSLAGEREKILQLHHAQRDYHFNKDSLNFTGQLSDDFISVNRGAVSRPARAVTLSRYNRYFSSVEFVRWDDVAEPIIRFSEDGSMAYTIVDKIVVITFADENGDLVEEETHFAWTTIYKKYGEEWKIDCVTSTNEPSSTKRAPN